MVKGHYSFKIIYKDKDNALRAQGWEKATKASPIVRGVSSLTNMTLIVFWLYNHDLNQDITILWECVSCRYPGLMQHELSVLRRINEIWCRSGLLAL